MQMRKYNPQREVAKLLATKAASAADLEESQEVTLWQIRVKIKIAIE